jgi:putative membrane protein
MPALLVLVAGALNDPQILGVMMAAHEAEVRTSAAAQPQLVSPTAQPYAERMIVEHSQALEALVDLGVRNGLSATDSELRGEVLGAAASLGAMMQEATAGRAFDLTYLCGQERMHADVLALVDYLRAVACNAELRAQLDVMRGTVQSHLELARQSIEYVGYGESTGVLETAEALCTPHGGL